MEINDFIQHFAEQFDETELGTFKPDMNFRNIDEWSSLNALSIIAMVDEVYNVRLSGDDIKNSESIEDLFSLVKSRVS